MQMGTNEVPEPLSANLKNEDGWDKAQVNRMASWGPIGIGIGVFIFCGVFGGIALWCYYFFRKRHRVKEEEKRSTVSTTFMRMPGNDIVFKDGDVELRRSIREMQLQEMLRVKELKR